MVSSVTTVLKKILPTVFSTAIILLPSISPADVSYAYDIRHRLTEATYNNGVTVSYSYDSVGNRLTNITTGLPYSIYEDAEDGTINGWDVYDNDPAGATISNVFDDIRQSNVIELTGAATTNGYRLRSESFTYWDDSDNKVMEWSMQYSEDFVIYIAAQTRDGFRYIYYTPSGNDSLGDSTYVHHGLGSTSKNGNWQTFTRDLEYDLKEAQPGNELEAILGFLIRGTGKVDDIRAYSSIPIGLDSDNDTIPDIEEINTYGTHPYKRDSDGDSIDDGAELSYWGTNWNGDIDADGLINLLDSDSDGDGTDDGAEIAGGTDPGSNTSYPTTIVYENAESGTLTGWDIYDNDPTGAIIDNVFDSERDSRVIEFTGSATSNGYRLRDNTNSYWKDTNFKVMQWSMKYSEGFTVFIAVQTTDGFRYIYYTPVENDNLGDSTYIHHGLGIQAMNGSWQTFVRDLEYDLKEAQPSNNLEAVLGFLIRGSGRVDDIMTREAIPATQDSDNDGIPDSDEINTYSTHPYQSDSDNDALSDGAELIYWGSAWNEDQDSDTLINILDPDSDADGILDGIEVDQGTDPGDNTSYPTSRTYEDAEDNSLNGWDIYDGDPVGAIVTNVYDDIKNSHVIELNGTATSNGYRLRNNDFSYWYDTNFNVIEWSMRYSESYVVYIAAQTKDGFRYIYYTPAEADNLGTETYVHHGLGGQTIDGSWYTISRDLESDLKDAQPDNEIEAVLGFLIRGSGRVDDIKTRESLPAAQ